MENFDLFENMLLSFCTDKKFFIPISEISLSDEENPESVVLSDFKIIYFDKLCDEVHRNLCQIDSSSSKHRSVDGFYFIRENNGIKLFFIEFKHINSKNRGKNKLKKITKPSLKLKAFESLFCVLPHLIRQYCGEDKVNSIQSQLVNVPKYYLCVLKDRGNVNMNNEHVIASEDFFDMERLSKYPFTKSIVISPKTFKTFMEKKFYTNPI